MSGSCRPSSSRYSISTIRANSWRSSVVSDGSTDDTDAIALSFADRGVSLLRVPHGGKPAALNAAIPAASGEILVLTDVRQELAVDCLQTLVNNFADPAVGVVSGHLIIRRGASRDESEVGLYWRYETWIRDNLSRLDSMFGATGPIYAIRKNLARPLPPDILLDDMALPLFAFFEGWRLIVEPAARAYDVPTGRDVEFTRKVRTLAGNWQLLRYQPKLLTPANRMLWHYLSYKLGRLLLPFFLMTIARREFRPHRTAPHNRVVRAVDVLRPRRRRRAPADEIFPQKNFIPRAHFLRDDVRRARQFAGFFRRSPFSVETNECGYGPQRMAVRVGFEPTEPAKVQRFSRPPDSTALAPHRNGCFSILAWGAIIPSDMRWTLSISIAVALLAATACRDRSRTIVGVVPKATSHLFFASIHAGVDQAARDFHLDVQWNGPNEETEHERQIQIVDGMITQHVSAMAISATDERALAGPVERAIKAGIPVVVFDSGVDVDNYVSFVATDNFGAGQTAARKLAGLIGGKGKVAMVAHKPGGTSTVYRERGFEETMAKEFPGVQIVARQFGMADLAKSRAAAENILTANPGLDGVFASSEASSLGSIKAIETRGLTGKVKLVTFDFSDAHVEALKNGTIDVMLVQDPYRIGYEALKAVADHLAGKPPARRLDMPARVIVKADLEKPEIQQLLFPPWLKKSGQ